MKTLDQRLAAIALVAITLYVLACGPAFSPDGRRILVTSTDTNGVSRVLMFDRKTSGWTLLAQRRGEEHASETPLAAALWLPDGRHAVVQWWREKGMQVMVLPIGEAGPTRLFDVPDLEDNVGPFVLSPPIVRGRLLIGGQSLRALDLKTGDLTEHPLQLPTGETNDMEVLVHAQQDGAYCIYGKNQDLTIGRVNSASLAVTPVLKLEDIDDGGFFFAVCPKSKRLAVVVEKEGNPIVRIYKAQLLEREIRLGTGEKTVAFGNLAWSPDGRTLYAATFEKAALDGDRALFGVHELPADGGTPRQIPLFAVKIKGETPLYHQFALSPDGKALAAFGGVFLDEKTVGEKDWALFLADLSRPDRRVKKYPIPSRK